MFNDLFNLSVEDLKETSKSSSNEKFKPDPKNGKDNVYKAIVRFIPNHLDPKNKSIIKKWTCWLEDPVTGEGKQVDCPTSIGEKSPIYDAFWKLKNSKSAKDQKNAEIFSRKQRFASIVQILKDDNNPENVGKLMVWEYGIKIHNKIQAELSPEEFSTAHNPFDVFNSKPFLVYVTMVSGYPNYDNSKFLDERTAITINNIEMKKDKDSMNIIFEYLKNGPDLSKYEFKPWDDATRAHVEKVMNHVFGENNVTQTSVKQNAPVKQVKEKIETVASLAEESKFEDDYDPIETVASLAEEAKFEDDYDLLDEDLFENI
jgi:hypothetical protein